MPCVDEPGLHVSLQPPASLVSGLAGRIRGFLICPGVEHSNAEASQRKPECEICILGHVVWIPRAPDALATVSIFELPRTIRPGHGFEGFPSKVVASAAQRRDQAQSRQAGEDRLEVDHILGPIEGTDPASARIPEGKPRL
jgi:hypothetical protein